MVDGYQLIQKDETGREKPVSQLFGSFREAVEEKMRRKTKGEPVPEIRAIYNNNNSK